MLHRSLIKGLAIVFFIILALKLTLVPYIVDMFNKGIELKRDMECLRVAKFYNPYNKTWMAYVKFRWCPLPDSHERVEEYRKEIEMYAKRRLETLEWLYRKEPGMKIYANIHLIRPVEAEEYMELVRKYNLTVIAIKDAYFDKNGEFLVGGVGPGNISEALRIALSSLMRHGVIKSVDEIRILISGFIVYENVSKLYKLQEDPLVYLVDVGPMDVIMRYKAMGYVVVGSGPEWLSWLGLPGFITHSAKGHNITLTKIR